MSGFRAAIALMTRVPVRGSLEERDLARSVAWFPVAGVLVGLVVGGTYAGTRAVLPQVVAATLAVGAGLMMTGALHEDGLADTADAFGAGRTREEILGILKDPAHGTYGILALVLGLVLRVGAIASLDSFGALAALSAAHAMSRGVIGAVVSFVRPATELGLGATYAQAATKTGGLASAFIGIAIGVASLGIWGAPAAIVCALAAAGLGFLSVRRIGGVTGDVLGAVQQLSEVGVLVLAASIGAGSSVGSWW